MELRDFFVQLSTTVKSGLTLGQAMHIIAPQFASSGELGRKIQGMGKLVEKGDKLSTAMTLTGKPFTRLHIALICFAEETGSLDRVLAMLATHAEKEVSLSWEVLQAFIYPGFVLFASLMVQPIILFFTQGGGLLEGAGSLTLFLGLIFVFRWLFENFNRGNLDGILGPLPYFGRMIRTIAWARFIRTLAMSQEAGIPLSQGVITCLEVGSNAWLKEKVAHVPGIIDRGQPLSEGLATISDLPPSIREMIIVGEQSGTLPEMLAQAATTLENEVNNHVNTLMKILPTIVFLVAAGVAAFTIVSTWTRVLVGLRPR